MVHVYELVPYQVHYIYWKKLQRRAATKNHNDDTITIATPACTTLYIQIHNVQNMRLQAANKNKVGRSTIYYFIIMVIPFLSLSHHHHALTSAFVPAATRRTTQRQRQQSHYATISEEVPFVQSYLKTISVGDIAEIYVNKSAMLSVVKSILWTDKHSCDEEESLSSPPLFEVQTTDGNCGICNVDIGQITTVWHANELWLNDGADIRMTVEDISRRIAKDESGAKTLLDDLPVRGDELAMDALWQSKRKPSVKVKPAHSLTKQKINAFESEKIRMLLKRIMKQDQGLVTSVDAAKNLFSMNGYDGNFSMRVIAGIIALEKDSKLGGRFKRFSCFHVSNTRGANKVTVLNGGWLAVDIGVKAMTEAKKFAEREQKGDASLLLTEADQRIARRLECLAMGEVMSVENSADFLNQLEFDVKAALDSMSLPLSPEGAKEALVRIGRWSSSDGNKPTQANNGKAEFEPWSNDVLTAAKELVDHCKEKNTKLSKYLENGSRDESLLEHRIDLTKLPCLCIDARGTSFRDDAIGIRPRSSTRRKVNKEASKWEILVHITDVSDIYAPESAKRLKFSPVMQTVASARGLSRYDLPLGPLHLLPPVALEAMSLNAKGQGELNRCVTVWAYIDERTGNLMDCGLERTIISAPTQLTFDSATKLLDADQSKIPGKHRNEKAILDVFERVVSSWSDRRLGNSDIARKRNDRMAVRELIDAESSSSKSPGQKFERKRGNMIVDSALNIYAYSVNKLLRNANAQIPRAPGSGAANKGGRVGTAPLRRYIDGVAQRQALAVLCKYGGRPMSKEECIEASEAAGMAMNSLQRWKASKENSKIGKDVARQREALRSLAGHLASVGKQTPIQVVTTGRGNEIIVRGVGAIGKCLGGKDNLPKGTNMSAIVKSLQPDKGLLTVRKAKS